MEVLVLSPTMSAKLTVIKDNNTYILSGQLDAGGVVLRNLGVGQLGDSCRGPCRTAHTHIHTHTLVPH